MKALKYAIVSAILAFGIAAPVVSAQDDSAPKAKHSGGGHDMTAAWLKGITLTADQQTKVDAIKADVQAKKVTVKDAKAKVRDVLTDDQKTTFDANAASAASKSKDSSKGASSKKSKKSKGGEGGGGGGDE